MVERATTHATSEVGTILPTSLPSVLPNGKDEGPKPVVTPAPALSTGIAGADSHYSYNPSDAPTPALIHGCNACDNVSSATSTDPPPTLVISGTGLPIQNLPSTIAPALLQPALQDFSPQKQDDDEILTGANSRYSAAAKGKGKALSFFDRDPTELSFPKLDRLPLEDNPSLNSPSNGKWIQHTRPILQDYADRQITLPLGQRVNISLNEPSQFIQGALQLLASRDHPQNMPAEPSRQLGPQLLENFTDVHRWATEYFRARFAMPTVGSDIPVLLTIITNTFYEAHTQLIDSIVCAALDNMHVRGAATLDIGDFAFGYDFKMSHDLPFVAESSYRIHDTLERLRPQSPVNTPVNIPTITRSGRQIKLSKQAEAAANAENEKQAKSRQRKKEKEKKNQESVPARAMTPDPSVGVVVHTPSATASNHGNVSDTVVNMVGAGAKCPICGSLVPTPSNPPLAPQSQCIPIASSSRRATTRPAVSSNLRLAPLTAQLSPSVTLQPSRPAPPPPPISDTAADANTVPRSSEVTPRATALPIPTSSAQILAGNVRSPALDVTTGTSTYQNLTQSKATSVRGGRRTTRARGARANRGGRGRGSRGRGSRAAAPLTIKIPAHLVPAIPGSMADPGAGASTEAISRTDAILSGPSDASGAGTTNATDSGSTGTPLRTGTEGIVGTDAVRSDPLGASGVSTIPDQGPTPTTSTETPVSTETGVRSEPVSMTGGPGPATSVAASARTYYPRYYVQPSTVNTTATSGSTYYPRYYATQTTTANTTANTAVVSTANAYYPSHYSSTATTTANSTTNTATGPSRSTRGPVDLSDPEQLIAHVLAAGDPPGVRAGVSGSVACPTVTETNSEIQGSMPPSGSHVDIRQSKKRKLDDSE